MEEKVTDQHIRKNKVGVLKDIEEQYYPQIFKIINSTVVLGNKKKYNTLEYLEHQVMVSDVKAVKKFGFPTNDIEKAHLIKGVLIKFIEISKDIRRDQWKTASDPTKVGAFEARKHLTEEAVIDRNIRLIRRLHVGPETAKRYGVALSVEDLKNMYKEDDAKGEKMVKAALKDPAFKTFNDNFRSVYKLGEPTKESTQFLYGIYEDLMQKGEENSFGLKGQSLKAAINMVEKAIRVRRNTCYLNDDRLPKKPAAPVAEEAEREL